MENYFFGGGGDEEKCLKSNICTNSCKMNSYSKTMEMRQKEKVQWKTKFIYYFKLFWFCGGENFKSQTSWTSVQIIELLVILACHVCKHFLMKHIYSVEANILWPLPILFSIFFFSSLWGEGRVTVPEMFYFPTFPCIHILFMHFRSPLHSIRAHHSQSANRAFIKCSSWALRSFS